jgi:hypothetical protein
MTRGRCGSLLLHRKRLALSTPCRSPGASQMSSALAQQRTSLNRVGIKHTHRDRAGFTWQEPMTLNIHVPAVRLDALRHANNDNESRDGRGLGAGCTMAKEAVQAGPITKD